jgi:hypothetical protein
MLFGPQNWSLNFLSFVNFDFFVFLYFLKTNNINVDLNEEKSMNDAWKIERVQKTFENLNSFETMLKMLKTMQIY